MKKIVYLISSLKQNGPNRVLFSMLEGINKSEYELFIISFLKDNNLEYVEKLQKYGCNVYLLNLNKKIDIIFRGKALVNKLIKEINANIVHSHGILPDIVNSNIKKNGIVKITTIHDNMFEDYIYCFGKIMGNIYIRWHLFHLKKLDKCVCCSHSIYLVLNSYLKNITYVRNAIFKNHINIESYKSKRESIRKKYSIKENDIVFIYAGGLTKLKNVEKMIDFFEKSINKNEYLLVLGNGELKEDLEKNTHNKNIIFCGFCENIVDYLCASDVYCSFSSSEGFSISILEAIEHYNLLLLNNIPSHKEIINITSDIYLGEIFNERNIMIKKKMIINRIKKININDYNSFLNEKLSIYKMMAEYSDLYKSLLERNIYER